MDVHKLYGEVHDLARMFVRAKSWFGMVERLTIRARGWMSETNAPIKVRNWFDIMIRIVERARNWFDNVDGQIQSIMINLEAMRKEESKNV